MVAITGELGPIPERMLDLSRIDALQGIQLEAGSLGLEQSLAAFEEGVRLSRRGAEILDRAEARVEALTRGEDGDRVVPMPQTGSAPGEGEGGS